VLLLSISFLIFFIKLDEFLPFTAPLIYLKKYFHEIYSVRFLEAVCEVNIRSNHCLR
jgi:hypothetical protein